MGGDHDGVPECRQPANGVADEVGRRAVELGRRLVGEQRGGIAGGSEGEGDAFPFAAGEAAGFAVAAVPEPEGGEQFARGGAGTAQAGGELEVFVDGEVAEEVVDGVLEDVAEPAAAESAAAAGGQGGGVDPVDLDAAADGAFEAGEEPQQGGFAGAGRSDERGDRPRAADTETSCSATTSWVAVR